MPRLKPAHKSRRKKEDNSSSTDHMGRPRKITKADIIYTILVIAWAGLSLLASQFIVSQFLQIIVGQAASSPVWTLVFYILSYSMALAMIILLPPRIWRVYQEQRQNKINLVQDSTLVKEPESQYNIQDPAEASDSFATSRQELGIAKPPTFVDIGLAPIAYIAYLLIANVVQAFMGIFPWYNAEESQNVGFGYFVTDIEKFAAMFALIIIAPIAEEIIMRGWVYGKLRRRIPVAMAMILTSILFGALHGQWNVAITTFVLSMILCGLREITGTIWSGILLHMLVNGIAFYILYIGIY